MSQDFPEQYFAAFAAQRRQAIERLLYLVDEMAYRLREASEPHDYPILGFLNEAGAEAAAAGVHPVPFEYEALPRGKSDDRRFQQNPKWLFLFRAVIRDPHGGCKRFYLGGVEEVDDPAQPRTKPFVVDCASARAESIVLLGRWRRWLNFDMGRQPECVPLRDLPPEEPAVPLVVESSNRAEPVEAKEMLFGWDEIMAAVKRPNDESTRAGFRRYNNLHGGPLISIGQGSRPMVEKSALIEWWNSLGQRLAELEQRKLDEKESLSSRHSYGKGGVVRPEIDGADKRRRKDHKGKPR